MVKVTEKGSKIAEKLDLNSDGILSDNELHDLKIKEMEMRIADDNAKRDQQRYLVWFSALTVTAFIIVLMTPLIDIDRLSTLSGIAEIWVLSNMGIIGSFIGFTQLAKRNENNGK
tara:strand:+ start:463 stop:807 length:345 start_codon:yes stop_codon:yes gene_type:complete